MISIRCLLGFFDNGGLWIVGDGFQVFGVERLAGVEAGWDLKQRRSDQGKEYPYKEKGRQSFDR